MKIYFLQSLDYHGVYVGNKLVSYHFHCVKNCLFSSANPHDFDGMLGTELPVSMYTAKTPIDKCRFNVTQLKEFFTFSVKDISIKLFYLYQRLQYTDNYFCKIKFVLFHYLLLSASWKENDLSWYISVIGQRAGYRTLVFTQDTKKTNMIGIDMIRNKRIKI
jgi:hypothetical protein